MTVKIAYKNSILKKNVNNVVFFVDEKFDISNIKKYISIAEYDYTKDLLKKLRNRKVC